MTLNIREDKSAFNSTTTIIYTKFMFETRTIGKMPGTHEYPVSEEELVAALSDIPQEKIFSATYCYIENSALSDTLHDHLFTLMYHYRKPAPSLSESAETNNVNLPEWDIKAEPVLVHLKDTIHKLLIKEGLLEMRNWLYSNAQFTGSEMMLHFLVSYNKETRKLEYNAMQHYWSGAAPDSWAMSKKVNKPYSKD